jgi:ABC-type multidrug transport system ATPase subunit
MKIQTTVLAPTSGWIEIAGCDPVRQRAAARRTFGIVLQDSSLDEELTAQIRGPCRSDRVETLLGFSTSR